MTDDGAVLIQTAATLPRSRQSPDGQYDLAVYDAPVCPYGDRAQSKR
jgi:hypothetical protein